MKIVSHPPFLGATPALPIAADQQVSRWLTRFWVLLLAIFIAAPMAAIFVKAVQGADGGFVGLANLWSLANEQRFIDGVLNSLALGLAATALVIPFAFAFAFSLTRSRLLARPVFRLIALAPLLAPSLMPAISLIYLFGNQGLLKSWLGSYSIYGPIGIVLGEAFYTFPHAALILVTALSVADARLYEAAETLGAGKLRRFFTVTLPNTRYGLISACLVVFTLVVTDFGIPKVIGGQMNVLALEAYKQVIGQQNFAKGAVVGLFLLLPALLSFGVEQWLSRGKSAALSGRSVAFSPKHNPLRDLACLVLVALVSLFLLALMLVAVAASLMKLWPYNLSFTLAHYDFEMMDGGGWQAVKNSLTMAVGAAFFGPLIVFFGAYLIEKTAPPRFARQIIRALMMLPMAVPGLVLGLGYIFFFNQPQNPLHALYGTMAILIASTISHFYTTAHLTASTALKQIDPEIESVAASLKRPFWFTASQVTLPMCLPTLIDIARFFFVSAMTTVSVAIFLYTPDTVLAAVAVLNMDDAGDIGPAAAMATLILAISLSATLLLNLFGHFLNIKTQAWRNK